MGGVSASVSGATSIWTERIPPSHHPEECHVSVQYGPFSDGMPEGSTKVADMLQQPVQPTKNDDEHNEEKPLKK